jgi:DNA-binding transcriptional MocR family regulator
MLQVHLQPESHIPLYIQLRDQVRAMVHAGDLRSGDRIPASRELAGQLGIHRTTVANAYAELESEGLIEGHVGRGTFICGIPEKRFSPPPRSNGHGGKTRWEALFADERAEEGISRLMPVVPAGAIAFTVARPPEEFFPAEEFRRCANIALRREGRRILSLGSTDGYEPLRQELAAWFQSEGQTVRPEELLITDGCQQAIDLICKAFLRPGDSIAIENPGYPGAISIFSAARARMFAVPVETGGLSGENPVSPHSNRSIGTNGSNGSNGSAASAGSGDSHIGLDIAALETVLTQNRVKFIFVTPDYHNPTGTAMPLASRRRLLELASRFQVPVIEDGIYARVHLRGAALPSLKSLDTSGNVIQIDSFSKIAFPGLRVGWAIGAESAIERLRSVKQSTDLHTDQLSQATLAEFMRRGSLTRHLARMKKIYRSRLEAMEEALARHMPNSASWTHPNGGMSLWVTLPPGFDSGELLIHARERGIYFLQGRLFYLQQPRPNTLRLGFASVDEKHITRGIQILGDILKSEMRERGGRSELAARVAVV